MRKHEDSFPEQYGALLRSRSSVSPSLPLIEEYDSDDTSKDSTDGTLEDSTDDHLIILMMQLLRNLLIVFWILTVGLMFLLAVF